MTAESTLEHHIYARIDEILGPINTELDAVNTRLTALAASYEALTLRIGGDPAHLTPPPFEALSKKLEAAEIRVGDAHRRCDVLADNDKTSDVLQSAHAMALGQLHADYTSFKETVDRVLDSYEGRFEQWERRDKQVELQLEGLARDVGGLYEARDALSDRVSTLENGLEHPHAVGALRDEVDKLRTCQGSTDTAIGILDERLERAENACTTARAVNVEQTTRIGRYGQKIEELTHALEDHVHSTTTGAAMLQPPPHFDGPGEEDGPWAPGWRERSGQDTYEVDGNPATRAEYEAAENDPQAPHTTRHVHRPFSDPAPCPETRDIGWAVQKLRAGRDVRRRGWVNTGTKAYIGPRLELRISNPATGTDAEYIVPQHELWATDWEIAP